MAWIIYIVAVLAVSGVIGMHLKNFAEVYTEMTGMMAGMTMGMLNGFVLGYAAASAIGGVGAAGGAMFWGNLFGILMGIALGVYFGRPGGLMGIMDGAMGGVMGGSMGAMLSVMVRFPEWAILWTGVLLTVVYIVGMAGLVVLIERSAPGHEALHRLTPFFARAISLEIAEAADDAREAAAIDYASSHRGSANGSSNGHSNGSSNNHSNGAAASHEKQRRLVNYYALLGVRQTATEDEILEAYLERLDNADEQNAARLEKAIAVLTDPAKRETYDLRLLESQVPAGSALLTTNGKVSNGRAVSASYSGYPAQAASAASTSTGQGSITARPAGSGSAKQGSQNGLAGAGKYGGGYAAGYGEGGSQNGAAHDVLPGSGSKQGGSSRGSGSKHGNKGGGQRQTGNQAARKAQVRYAQMPQERSSPISWVGGLAALVIVVMVVAFVMNAGAARGGGSVSGSAPGGFVGAGGETQAQLDQIAVVAPVGADGKQTIDVVLDSATLQYKPKAIKVKQGVPVHFNLSVENGDPG